MTDVGNAARTCWVTGAGGLIGSHIAAAAPPSWRPIALTRSHLDLGDFDAVRARFDAHQPAAVIHCAAISKAAECERDPQHARHINVDLTVLLAELASRIPLLYLSSDLVFDGAKGCYSETDTPNPLTVYARTKHDAEAAVLANRLGAVVRTSLNGGASSQGDRSFTEQLISAWRAGRMPKLFVDEFRSPIMASVTARAVWELLERNATGLFHVGGAERLSRFKIGELVAQRVPRLNPRIEAASLRDYVGPTRAPDTSLDSTKVREVLSFKLPCLSEWLETNWPVEQ